MSPTETAATLRQFIDWRRDTSNWPPSPMLIEKAIDAAIAMIDRLEAAEKERDALRLAVRHEADCVDAAKVEIEALHAKIEEMRRQEPVAYLSLSSARMLESGVIASGVVWNCRDKAASDIPLYALPGAKGE